MNIRPVDKDFFRFTSKYGKRKLVIELDGNCTKDELCEAFTAFLNASGYSCLLYTSPSPRDRTRSRMPSSA